MTASGCRRQCWCVTCKGKNVARATEFRHRNFKRARQAHKGHKRRQAVAIVEALQAASQRECQQQLLHEASSHPSPPLLPTTPISQGLDAVSDDKPSSLPQASRSSHYQGQIEDARSISSSDMDHSQLQEEPFDNKAETAEFYDGMQTSDASRMQDSSSSELFSDIERSCSLHSLESLPESKRNDIAREQWLAELGAIGQCQEHASSSAMPDFARQSSTGAGTESCQSGPDSKMRHYTSSEAGESTFSTDEGSQQGSTGYLSDLEFEALDSLLSNGSQADHEDLGRRKLAGLLLLFISQFDD